MAKADKTEEVKTEKKAKSNVTPAFKESIKKLLDDAASQDELFAVSYAKTTKNLDECCNYVMSQAKTLAGSGNSAGVDDSDVLNWAMHYYDEDDIKNVKSLPGKVVVNHQVELTEADKEKAKKAAIEIATNEMIVEAKKELTVNVKLTEEEIAEAKKTAMDKVISETQEKMTKKKTVKKSAEEKSETPTLF